MKENYVIGVDFGTDSARAVIVNTVDGEQISCAQAAYRRWGEGLYQDPRHCVFRQHPIDYLEALEKCICGALEQLTEQERECIVGIGVDVTGSTPGPVDRSGNPLAMSEEYGEDENAMFYLWKDLSAEKEAQELVELFRDNGHFDYTKYQAEYGAERFWSKILHAKRISPDVTENAYAWVEACDWITGVLCGNADPDRMSRSACAAGHKALWCSEWNGYPSAEVLGEADDYLAQVRSRMTQTPKASTEKAGYLCEQWSRRLGLSTSVAVAVGTIDAHAAAVGAGIRENTIACTLGTSCVGMSVKKKEEIVPERLKVFCGMAENAILPGLVSLETGQASFGDNFAWFRNILLWSGTQGKETILDELQDAAQKLSKDDPFPVILDWFNGRRYPNGNDQALSVIAGLSLGVGAPHLYRALVFGTVAGLYRLIEGMEKNGVAIERIIAGGGITARSPYVIQMLADLSGKQIDCVKQEHTSAQGAAIHAAVAAGVYQNMETAIGYMASKIARSYMPEMNETVFLRKQYKRYLTTAKTYEET